MLEIGEGKRFYGDVKFYFLWSNPKDKVAVINVDGYAIFHGYAYVGVGGGIFPGDRMASVSVDGRLDILEWWNQPPTQPPTQPDQLVNVASLRVTAYGWSEVGAIDAREIYRGYDLRHTLFLVPPFGTLVFTVTAAVSLSTGSDSGFAQIDFASGAYQVGSPAVLVAVLSSTLDRHVEGLFDRADCIRMLSGVGPARASCATIPSIPRVWTEVEVLFFPQGLSAFENLVIVTLVID